MGGGREDQDRGGLHVPVADSCCCVADINTILQSSYPPITKKFFFNKISLGSLFKCLKLAWLGVIFFLQIKDYIL